MKRFFINSELGAEKLTLCGAEHNHLANVLRLKTGDTITAVCGDEFDYTYRVLKITKTSTELQYVVRAKNTCNPSVRITVFMAVIKFDNLSLVIQKLNEIGVAEVIIFNSANCNLPIKSVNIEKLQKIAEQSCKQCGRSIPLSVTGVLSFERLLNEIPKNTVFADERETEKRISGGNAVIIGPEGGFTEAERNTLKTKTEPVTLGHRILRAETAAIAAASILLNKMGEI